jgi:hypothetical protein
MADWAGESLACTSPHGDKAGRSMAELVGWSVGMYSVQGGQARKGGAIVSFYPCSPSPQPDILWSSLLGGGGLACVAQALELFLRGQGWQATPLAFIWEQGWGMGGERLEEEV